MIADVDLVTRKQTGLAAGAALLVGGAALLFALAEDPTRGWANLLLENFYFLCLALGGLFFLAVLRVAGAGWATAIRRVPEALSAYLPLALPLMLPLLLGSHDLYRWTDRSALAADPVMAGKAPYLNLPFFALRMVFFLVVWAAFSVVLRRLSRRQDASPAGIEEHRRMVRWSAAFLVVFAFTFSLASFDWILSLEPDWVSTVFGVYTFSGLFLGALAAVTIGVVILREDGPLKGIVTEEHLHDLGKMLFAFSIFWAYIWVSQYLLIWYGDLPEEVTHFVRRTNGSWQVLFALNVVLNWGVPFLVLMSRAAKRSPRILLAVAGVILIGRWVDLYLLIMPPLVGSPRIGIVEVAVFAGFAGFFLLVARRALAAGSLVPTNDPYVKESLSYLA